MNDVWMLANACLHQFNLSRDPVFTYAAKALKADFLALDFIRADAPSLLDRLLLKIICRLVRLPKSSFLILVHHRTRMPNAGYQLDHVEVSETSRDVFATMATGLRWHSRGFDVP